MYTDAVAEEGIVAFRDFKTYSAFLSSARQSLASWDRWISVRQGTPLYRMESQWYCYPHRDYIPLEQERPFALADGWSCIPARPCVPSSTETCPGASFARRSVFHPRQWPGKSGLIVRNRTVTSHLISLLSSRVRMHHRIRTCFTSNGVWISGTFPLIYRSNDGTSIGWHTAPAMANKDNDKECDQMDLNSSLWLSSPLRQISDHRLAGTILMEGVSPAIKAGRWRLFVQAATRPRQNTRTLFRFNWDADSSI